MTEEQNPNMPDPLTNKELTEKIIMLEEKIAALEENFKTFKLYIEGKFNTVTVYSPRGFMSQSI